MTDDLRRDSAGQGDLADWGVDAPLDPDRPDETAEEWRLRRDDVLPDEPDVDEEKEPNPLLREGADAPDAADIEDPEHQL